MTCIAGAIKDGATPFIYDKDIPAPILPALQKVLEPWAWIVPVWCERVFVGWSEESHEANYSATTNVEYPYRWARITFYPCFLKQDDMLRDALHELIHIPMHVVTGWTREKISTLVPEDDAPKFRKVLFDELTARCESATEDLTSRIIAHSRAQGAANAN